MPESLAAPLLHAPLSTKARAASVSGWLVASALSGWLVAAAIGCAFCFQHFNETAVHQAYDASLPSAQAEALTEVWESDGGLDCHWLVLNAIRAAGFGQIALVLASAAIPFLLDYKKELSEIKKPLIKQMFLVYSGYILIINLLFGLLSAFAAESIVQVGFLPSVITGFIFLYWFARLMIALFVFDLSFLNRPHEIVGRVGIELLFLLLPLTYGLAFAHDMGVLSLNYTVPDIGPFGRMLIIIITMFMVIKILVFMMPKSHAKELTAFQKVLFLFVWPGMRPESFLERTTGLDWWRDAMWGFLFATLGACLSVGIKYGRDAGLSPGHAGLLSLPAISMMFHFGGLRLLRGAFRLVGYDVEKLFVDPLYATSMDDFWGKRWNMAFSDMNRFVFMAAAKTALEEDLKFSKGVAFTGGLFTAFIASALLHEAAITLPVLAGYGGPSLYFLIQGVCVVVEKRPPVAEWQKSHPVMARVITWIGIAAPFPICFQEPFCTEIALPVTMFVANLPSWLAACLVNGP